MRAKGLEDLVEYDTRSRIPAAHSALSGNTKKMDLTRITSAQGRGGAQEYVARVVPDFENALEKAMSSDPEILFVAAAGNSNSDSSFNETVKARFRPILLC